MKTCDQCDFFSEGVCFLQPPVFISGSGLLRDSWARPIVVNYDFCNDFSDAETVAAGAVVAETVTTAPKRNTKPKTEVKPLRGKR